MTNLPNLQSIDFGADCFGGGSYYINNDELSYGTTLFKLMGNSD